MNLIASGVVLWLGELMKLPRYTSEFRLNPSLSLSLVSSLDEVRIREFLFFLVLDFDLGFFFRNEGL